jgi:hypothetical protein
VAITAVLAAMMASRHSLPPPAFTWRETGAAAITAQTVSASCTVRPDHEVTSMVMVGPGRQLAVFVLYFQGHYDERVDFRSRRPDIPLGAAAPASVDAIFAGSATPKHWRALDAHIALDQPTASSTVNGHVDAELTVVGNGTASVDLTVAGGWSCRPTLVP